MCSYLNKYIGLIKSRGNSSMAESIKETAKKFENDYLSNFSFIDHEIGLLFGNVQAGKTAQMFGIVCVAADNSFPIFLLLTTDNTALQQQTYKRVLNDLSDCGFCICDESDKQKFVENQLVKPAIIVLKKNSKVLLQWYNTLASSSFVYDNTLFIIDDEADAASPNTLVNKNRVSSIHTRLTNIRNTSIGSIYLQVTGTPQALLLQSTISDFRPAFTCYFQPGIGYLGGEFFFNDEHKPIRFLTDESNYGLYDALMHHLVVSAQLFLTGTNVCNFVVHPGVLKSSHSIVLDIINKMIIHIQEHIGSDAVIEKIKQCYDSISPEKSEKCNFEDICAKISEILDGSELKVLIMNGDTAIVEEQYKTGSNIIIGGNVLGRGVTFPKLHTLYYTRTAKRPQADTMWQHSRMFGYDRDPGLVRVYLTRELYKLFADINAGNNSIISQVERGLEKIQLFYPEGINPTRKNVIDVKMVDLIAGGTHYYPDNPDNVDVAIIDRFLSSYEGNGSYFVSIKKLIQLLSYIVPSEDFNKEAFISVMKALVAENAEQEAVLIVRRDRDVTQGTGSLISPNDRQLSDSFTKKFVLTMYRVTGQGWKKPILWVPDIRIPEFLNFYNVH